MRTTADFANAQAKRVGLLPDNKGLSVCSLHLEGLLRTPAFETIIQLAKAAMAKQVKFLEEEKQAAIRAGMSNAAVKRTQSWAPWTPAKRRSYTAPHNSPSPLADEESDRKKPGDEVAAKESVVAE